MYVNRTCPEEDSLRRDPVRRTIFFVCIALILAPSLAGAVGMLING